MIGQAILEKDNNTYLTEEELKKDSSNLLDLKYWYRYVTDKNDPCFDKYISPPRGYMFGEDVS